MLECSLRSRSPQNLHNKEVQGLGSIKTWLRPTCYIAKYPHSWPTHETLWNSVCIYAGFKLI